VTIEGSGVSGVTVTLSSGETAPTDASGGYIFANVPAGSYTVTISGYPSDATFSSTSRGVVLSEAGETVTANFDGEYIRTSSIAGTVAASGEPLAGVTVSISGAGSQSLTTTDAAGAYAFSGLRGGSYTVQISGFDANKYTFDSTSQAVTLAAGGSAVVNFLGSEAESGEITANVTIDGAAAQGITVTLAGPASDTEVTNSAGQAMFGGLAKGTYSVSISGFDTNNIEFDNLSQNATIAEVGDEVSVSFAGTTIANAGVSGRVYNDNDKNGAYEDGVDTPWEGVQVSLSGQTATTDADGLYSFTDLTSGNYVVSMTNPDLAELQFDGEDDLGVVKYNVNISNPNSSFIRDFRSVYRENNAIMGRVWLDLAADGEYTSADEPAAGFTMTAVNDALGLSREAVTDADGLYAFEGMRSGMWTLTCVSCPADFGGRQWDWTPAQEIELGAGITVEQNFLGTVTAYTSTISGQLNLVTIDGEHEGLWDVDGVEITLVGPMIPGEGDEPTQTLETEGGMYTFEGLAPGNYEMTIDDQPHPGVDLVGNAMIVVNVPDELGIAVTAPTRQFEIVEYTIRVPVVYGGAEMATDAGDWVELYQSEQMAGPGGNFLGSDETDDAGLAVFMVDAEQVVDDYVLFSCLDEAATTCEEPEYQEGATLWKDGILEHSVDPLGLEQTLEKDHNMVFNWVDAIAGQFVEQDGVPVPETVTNNDRVGLVAYYWYNVDPDADGAVLWDESDLIYGDEDGDALYSLSEVTAPGTPAEIAAGFYFLVSGWTCYDADCGVGASDNLLKFAGDVDRWATFYFDGSSMMPMPTTDGTIVTSYPNPDIIFRVWHENNDVPGFQADEDDAIENDDIEAYIRYDRNDDGMLQLSEPLDCRQPDVVNDPTRFRCYTDATDGGPDFVENPMKDLITREDVSLYVVSNDLDNTGGTIPGEMRFIVASEGWDIMVDNSGDYDLMDMDRPASSIDITGVTTGNDLRFSIDASPDGFGYKFAGNTARVVIWDEVGAYLDADGIRDEGVNGAERAVGGVIVEIDVADGQLGFEDFMPMTLTTEPNVNQAPPNGNAGVVRFDGLLEGTYDLSIVGLDGEVFNGSLVVVDRSSGMIEFDTPEQFSGSVDVQVDAADTKASPANQYEVQYTNGELSGYVFENEDDNNVIDPSEGIIGAGKTVALMWLNPNTGEYEEVAQSVADETGFWAFMDVQEGDYYTMLMDNGTGISGNPAERSHLFYDTGRYGQENSYDGSGVDLLGMPAMSGDAFDGDFLNLTPAAGETDLEIIHTDGTIRYGIKDGAGAYVSGIDVTLTFCEIDPSNVESDNAGAGGVCANPSGESATLTTNPSSPIVWGNLSEGFWRVTFNPADVTGIVSGTATWTIRIDRQGEIVERNTVVTP
jgi:hypothetical protein